MDSTVKNELARSSPERQGIASSAVLQVVEALESQMQEIHGFMLLRHGSVVAEGWWSPYARELPHMLFSVSKSFTSTAVGLAVAEGLFSIDDTVMSFFPEEAGAVANNLLGQMRVRHLLTMTSGHAVDSWPSMVHRPDGDWFKGFLDVPVQHMPGTHFVYNSGATYMLSAIVQKCTGMKLVDYLQPRLFAPLGIEGASWQESPQGVTAGAIGLSIKTEDLARFGQLYLQKGLWQGRQIVPQAWVEAATSFQVSNNNSAGNDGAESDWSQGYGYQFWRCRHNAYRADGIFGQYCIVMPQQDAVLAITGGIDVFDMQPPLDLVWEILLPAMHAGALPGDNSAHHRLHEKLERLRRGPAQGERTSPMAAQVSGRSYRLDPNAQMIESIVLNFLESRCDIVLKTARGEERIACGYGSWQRSQTTSFNEPERIAPAPVAASGAWMADDTFVMLLRPLETPFTHTLSYHFADDELIIESHVNVSLESTAPLIMTARQTEATATSGE